MTNNVTQSQANIAAANVAEDTLELLTLTPNLSPVTAMRGLCMALGVVISASKAVGVFDPPDELLLVTIRSVEAAHSGVIARGDD